MIRLPLPGRLSIAMLLFALPVTQPAGATELTLPSTAELVVDLSEALGSYALPTGPWTEGAVPTKPLEGGISHRVWHIPGGAMTTLEILAPLRQQLAQQGFRVLADCDTDACGGFDFRYGTEVLPEPDMHVDLGNFRFLSAERDGPDGPEAVSLFVSRSATDGFVQMISVGAVAPAVAAAPGPAEPAAAIPDLSADVPRTAEEVGQRFDRDGAIALDDLVFDSGSARLDDGTYGSLTQLAAWLKANPDYRITLVGHTDVSGGLAGNVALSKARAASVRDRLIDSYDIAADRIAADGVGYLSPRASNLTAEGRARNRRVEAIITTSP